jgi:hypothetical protein
MAASYLRGAALGVPLAFARAGGFRATGPCSLENAAGARWEGKMTLSERETVARTRAQITSGWGRFAKANRVAAGDELRFECVDAGVIRITKLRGGLPVPVRRGVHKNSKRGAAAESGDSDAEEEEDADNEATPPPKRRRAKLAPAPAPAEAADAAPAAAPPAHPLVGKKLIIVSRRTAQLRSGPLCSGSSSLDRHARVRSPLAAGARAGRLLGGVHRAARRRGRRGAQR